jgi:hypothetical protein
MTHLTETQRIEIFILIGCGELDKTKTGEFLHKLAYCQQAGRWQFEHLIPQFLVLTNTVFDLFLFVIKFIFSNFIFFFKNFLM